MAKAFYRTYRPQTFADLYGQSHVKKTLESAIKAESFAHAYLFSGPRGVGKTTLARIISKSLNCTKRDTTSADPCNECDHCMAIMNGSAVDIIEIDAASNRGIDEIRSLREKARTTPLMLTYKVFIIDEVHMLTKEAFDALLKTLEEPKKHSLFILATTEFEKIPKTIISRCQTFELKTIPFDELLSYLKKIAVEEKLALSDEVLKYLVAYSGGYARDATSLLNQISLLSDPTVDEVKELFGVPLERDVLTLFEMLSSADIRKALGCIRGVVLDGRDVHHFSKIIQEYVRMMLLVEYVDVAEYSYDAPVDEASLEKMKALSSVIGKNKLTLFLKNLVELESKLKDSYHPELFLELSIIETFDFTPSKKEPIQEVFVQKSEKVYEQPDESFSAHVQAKEVAPDISPPPVSISEESPVSSVVNPYNTPVSKETIGPPVAPQPVMKNDEPEEIVKGGIIATTVEDIQNKWSDVLMEISKSNASLAGVVKSTCILELKNGILVLVADFGFHKEKVTEAQNKEIIERSLEVLFNERIRISCEEKTHISETDQAQVKKVKEETSVQDKKAREDSYNAAVEVFGVES